MNHAFRKRKRASAIEIRSDEYVPFVMIACVVILLYELTVNTK